MKNKNEEAMREGILNARCVIAIITEGPTKEKNYFKRGFCLKELRWALESNVKIQPVVRVQDKNAIDKLLGGAPDDLKGLGKIDFIDLNRGDADYFEAGVTKLVESLEEPNPLVTDGAPAVPARAAHSKAASNYVCLTGLCHRLCTIKLHLAHFPFDEQNLEFLIRLPKLKDTRFRFSFDSELDVESENIRKNGAGILEIGQQAKDQIERLHNFALLEETIQTSHILKEKTGALFCLRIARKARFYVDRFMSISGLLATLALTTVLVPPEDFADRMSITLTLLLTIVAQQSGLTENLPKIGYKTYLDRYNDACIKFIASIIAQNCLVIALSKLPKSFASDQFLGIIDVVTWGMLALAWMAPHVYFGIRIREYYQKHERQEIEDGDKDKRS